MKIRKDFVTNSSSSSFVCEICGRSESGWDMGLSDADMVECANGHTICRDEILDIPKLNLVDLILSTENCDWIEEEDRHSVDALSAMNDDELKEVYFALDETDYGIPEEFCPICQFIEYNKYDLSEYLERVYGVERDDVFDMVKSINKRRKKLYENEYITEVCKRFELNPSEIVAGWKERFGTYAAFKTYLNKG